MDIGSPLLYLVVFRFLTIQNYDPIRNILKFHKVPFLIRIKNKSNAIALIRQYTLKQNLKFQVIGLIFVMKILTSKLQS